MLEKIRDVLEKYEDDIISNVLGAVYDEFGQQYSVFYNMEWTSCLVELSRLINEMLKLGLTEDAIIYFIIAKFDKIISFEESQVNLKGLNKVCKKILKDVLNIDRQ